MRKPPPGQLVFAFPELEGTSPPRSKRLRFRTRQTPRPKRVPPPPSRPVPGLMRDPVATRCGLCGQKLTVFEDVGICPACNCIVGRPADRT
jgi:hypothetical protein